MSALIWDTILKSTNWNGWSKSSPSYWIYGWKEKWKPSNEWQIALTQSVVIFIAKNLLLLSLGAFREVLEKAQPSFTMPSLCSKLLLERSMAIYEDIKSKLCCAPSVHLTMDLWSSRDTYAWDHFWAFHYWIYSLFSYDCLQMVQFHGTHTKEAIRESYDEIVSKFEIADKIRCVITSGGGGGKLFCDIYSVWF